MVAAMGDTGKSFSLLRLAYLIATGNIYNSGQQIAFGGTVEVYGTAVVFTAEDCMNTIHSRVKAIDELDLLKDHPGKLIVIPLPDAGGPLTLVQKSRDSITTMPVYDQIKAQLLKIPDLRMVVFDPLQNFTTLDLNAPENSQYVCGVMAELATVTGAAVFVSHHMKKTEKQIRTIAEAREAIRGTTALVDGLRGAYALWPETDDDTRKICTDLGREYRYGSIVRGAIVKANGNADRRIKTFHRDHNGILQDVTEQVSGIRQHNLDVSVLVLVIAEAAERGHPFTTGGAAGITLERRGELPEPFSTLSRDILRGMVDDLIKDGRLVKAAHGNEKKPTWLDVPDGNFALGCGEFATGSSAQIEFEEVKE
jgi:RecA-family ATPase